MTLAAAIFDYATDGLPLAESIPLRVLFWNARHLWLAGGRLDCEPEIATDSG